MPVSDTLPPNTYLRGSNKTIFRYHELDAQNLQVGYNTFQDFGRNETFAVLLSGVLAYFFYRCCRTCCPDASNPLPLPKRKRKDSTVASIEMISYPVLRGLSSSDGTILQKLQTKKLQNVLPLSLQMLDWSLAYASNRDGYNLDTFYRLAEDQGPTLLVVTDSSGHVFGGFNSVSWERPKRKNGHTYGTGESFVFTVLPTFKHYPWSGSNSEFILSRQDCIGFGGGGKFALTLDERFQRGSSDTSETYLNPCLASGTMFDVVAVELWKFDRFR